MTTKQNLPPTPRKDKHAEREAQKNLIVKAVSTGEKTIGALTQILDLPAQTVRYLIIGLRDEQRIVGVKREKGRIYYSTPTEAAPPPPPRYPGTIVIQKQTVEPTRTASTSHQHINQIRLPKFPWQEANA